MIAVILAVALATAAAAAAVVVLVSVGARREPQDLLPVQARGPLTGLARHVLGLHVRRSCGQTAGATPDSWQAGPAWRYANRA